MGGDLDERQERITLALYGGALAALAFLVVTFLFYLQVILPLLGQLSAIPSDPGLGGAIAGDPAGDPTLAGTATVTVVADTGPSAASSLLSTTSEPATPRTQFFLLIAATLPGAAMSGWALCASWRRSVLVTLVLHLALIIVGFLWVTPQTGGMEFLFPLYLLPAVLIPALLLPQRPTPSFLIPPVLAALGFGLLVQVGWWAVPLAWVALPIAGAIVAARAARGAEAEA